MNTAPHSSSLTGMLLAAILALTFQPAYGGTLKAAGAMVGNVNGSVPFDRVYRVNAHNTFNPNTFRSLEEALDAGVRSIEIDVYGSFAGWAGVGVDRNHCDDLGGHWTVNPHTSVGMLGGVCSGYDPDAPRNAIIDSEADAVAGRPIATRPGQKFLRLQVKHDPTAEDGLTDSLWSMRWIIPVWNVVTLGVITDVLLDLDDEYYGNNCASGTAQGVGNMQTELAKCLQHVKTWMDNHPGHTPVMIYFDIKTDMDRLTATGFDATVRGVFGTKLFRPTDLQAGFPSMRARVAQAGWPSFDSLRNKVIGIYNGGETFQVFGDEQPNDTQRYYLDGLASLGFPSSATFVCPRISVAADVDTPYSFGRGPKATPESIARLMGQVVCNNIYTGKRARAQQTNSRTFEGAMGAVDAARARNLLTYVFSYNDPLAIHPEVAMEFIRHGVNLFDNEAFKLGPRDAERRPYSPLYSFGNNILPLEGLSGITNYGFVIRHKNSPYVLASVGGKPVLRTYDGSASQQWAMTSAGQLFALSNPASCISLSPTQHWVHDNYRESPNPVRSESLYTSVTGDGYTVPDQSEVRMAGCQRTDIPGFFTIVKSYQKALDQHGPADSNQNDGGISLALNSLKYNDDKPLLYLTTTQYNGDGTLIAAEFSDEHITPGQAMGARGERSIDYTFRAVRGGPVAPVVPGQTLFRQTFELYFDKAAAMVVDTSLSTAPQLSLIAGGNESRAGIPKPRTWRDYLPANDANTAAGRRDPLISDEDRTVLLWAHYEDPEKVMNKTLEYTKLPRDSGSWTTPKHNHLLQITGQMPVQAIVSELLSTQEYAKWLAAVDTSIDDLPRMLSTENLALSLFSRRREGDWGDHFNPNCNTKFCQWMRKPLITHPAPFKYWEVTNKSALWLMASRLLAPAEYEKWRAMIRLRPSDIALDSDLEKTRLAVDLLETGYASVFGNAPNAERAAWSAEGLSCFDFDPLDGEIFWPNFGRCPGRFLAEKRSYDQHYRWSDIPFDADHLPLAEAAFNNPRPGANSSITPRPAEWAKWQSAYALSTIANGRAPTYRDVPINAVNRDVVVDSNLLSLPERAKWLEKEYLETQFVAMQRPITHLDIDPDGIKAEVAREYLSPAQFALWQEREAVTVDDFPLNGPLFERLGAQLLSAAELSIMAQKFAVPDHGETPEPQSWLDIPPARGKRYAAEVLLSPTEYARWQQAYDATELDFPQVWMHPTVDHRARAALSPDEYSAWVKLLGPNPPRAPDTMVWLMFPHRMTARQVVLRTVNGAQGAIWNEMVTKTMLPQHLGTSALASQWARSALSATDYSAWLAQARNVPLTWTAFQFDSSLMQQRIVEAIFGVNSTDAAAWRAWAGRA